MSLIGSVVTRTIYAMGRAPNHGGAPQRVSAHVVPKAAAFVPEVDEDEKTTIESGWEEEASTTVEQGEVAEKIRALGLGGNVGTEVEIVERFGRAREAIAALGDVRSAPLYRSAPIGPAQAAFQNTAVRLRADGVQPAELATTLAEIERLLGRDRLRETRWGPRPIDLDVLVWGARAIRTPELEVPHARLAERKFALAPLVALLGEAYVVPGHGEAGTLLRAVAVQDASEIAAGW